MLIDVIPGLLVLALGFSLQLLNVLLKFVEVGSLALELLLELPQTAESVSPWSVLDCGICVRLLLLLANPFALFGLFTLAERITARKLGSGR
jgi:hypothetical protein